MNRLFLALATGVCLAVALAGCAGQLTTEEQAQLCAEHPGCLGGGSGGSTGTTGAGGSGGSAPNPADCVIAISAGANGQMPKCTTCHNDATTTTVQFAGFNFNAASIMNAKQMYLDKPGQGDPPGMMMACGGPGNTGKLIDSSAPDQSLIYTKLLTTVPCGVRMPQIPPYLNTTDQACVLAWVKSVVGP